jgi:hypothetical protein
MPESDKLEPVHDWLPDNDGSDPDQYSRVVIKNLNAENDKLRTKIKKLEADLEWAVEFTRLDGYPKHPRNITNIIKERDEAYAQLARLGKLLNLLMDDLKKGLGLVHSIEEMKLLTIQDSRTLPHIRSLTSFLTLVYDDLLIERRFYEAVMGKPLEWIPIRTEVIDDIESRIQVFDRTYDFGQRVCDGRDPRIRTITAAQGGGNRASKS